MDKSKNWHKFWYRFFLVCGIYLIITAFYNEMNGKNGILNLLIGLLDLYLYNVHRTKLKELENEDITTTKETD